MINKKKYYTTKDALLAMEKYCAKQERCQQEVRTKLIQGGIYGDELEGVIADLISSGFIDETRYTRQYVSGKFKINKWGRLKISQALQLKDISDYCIQVGLKEIGEDDYIDTIRQLTLKKIQNKTTLKMNWTERIKVFQYLLSKGYEKEVVNPILDEFTALDD